MCEVYLSFGDLVAEHRAGTASESPGLLATLDLPGVGEHVAPASPVRWSTGDPVPVRAPAALGHDTRAVLKDVLGLGPRELDALASRRVIES